MQPVIGVGLPISAGNKTAVTVAVADFNQDGTNLGLTPISQTEVSQYYLGNDERRSQASPAVVT